MAVMVKISSKSGKLVRTATLHKGTTTIAADPDAVVTVVDEKTGKIVENAHVVRNEAGQLVIELPHDIAPVTGDGSVASVPVETVGHLADGASSAAASSASSGVGGSVAGAGSGGGNSGLVLGILGALGLGGLAAAAGGGGGGGNGGGQKDTTAPVAPTGLALASADDTGVSNSDHITKLTSGLTITGNAEAGSTVTVKDGATTLGTATANGSGQFTLDVSLAAGTHSLTATATDAAGNVSTASSALAITVDTTAPVAPTGLALASADDTGESNSDHITKLTSGLTITGNAEAGSTVTVKDGATTLGTATANGSGQFTLDVSLAAGTHSLTATATDAAGNVSTASSALAITVDTTAPVAPTGLALASADDTGASNSDHITKLTSGLTITGNAEAGSTVTVKDGATTLGTATANGSGQFTLDVGLAAGTHSLTATATDAAGNVSTASSALAITVDTTAPVAPTGLALASADDTGASNSDHITKLTSGLTITGNAEAGSTVTVKDGTTTLGTATANGSGQFTLDVSLAAGTHSLTATATDAAGNVSTASSALAITVDTTAPVAPTGLALASADDTGVSNSDHITKLTSGLTITGNAEAGSTVTVKDGATTLGTATANGSGQFTLDVGLAAGSHSITATATDVAGNTGAASGALAITVDTTAPTLAISSNLATVAIGQTATLTFTFSERINVFPSSAISVTMGGVSAGTISNLTQGSGTVWTATLTPTASTSGTLNVSVATGAISDTAGNGLASTSSASLAFDHGTSGKATDGYVSHALVFRDGSNGFAADGVWNHEAFTDTNGNGIHDAGEAFVDANSNGVFDAEYMTITDAQGNFSGLAGSGAIVLTGIPGSIDISTGLAFTGTYKAPSGSTVVTPLTTLIVSLMADGKTQAEAESLVKASLGISGASTINLATFDPFVAASNPTTAALAVDVQKAAVQVANFFAVVASAATGAGASDGGAGAAASASTAIAAQIATGSNVNLGDTGTVTSLIQTVAGSTGGAVGTGIVGQAASLGGAISNVNTAVQQAAGTNAVDALTAVVSAQIVAQQNLASDAASGSVSSTDYSGAALATQLDTAATQVQTVIVQTAATGSLGDPDRPVVDPVVGTRVSGSEAAAGVGVTVSWNASDNVAVGDKLNLLIGGVVVKTYSLLSGDVPAGGASASHLFTLSAADLGADGGKAVTAQFVSAAGTSTSAASLPLLLTVDTTTTNPVINPVSGGYVNAAEAAAGVGATLGGIEAGSDTTVKISGASAANPANTVVFTYHTGSADYTIPTADLAQLADGTVQVSAQQTDAAGNVSANVSSTFVLDRAALAPTGLHLDAADDSGRSNSDNVTRNTSGLTISGSAEAGSTVRLYDGATLLATTTANGSGSFSADIALANGVHGVKAVATDLAGNVSSASTALSITVDNVAPAAPGSLALASADDTGSSNSDHITNLTSGLTITGSTEAGAIVTIKDGANTVGTGTADGTGLFSIDVSLAQGTHSLTATATDVAGNSSAASSALSITVDNSAPAAPTGLALAAADDSGASNSDGKTNQTSGLTITGAAEANSTVTLHDGANVVGTGTADGTGHFSIDVSLAEGSHQLTATATDIAGNVSSASGGLNLTIDATAPAAPASVNAPEGPLLALGAALDGTTITGTTEAGSSVMVMVTGTLSTITRAASVSGTNFSLALSKADLDALGTGHVTYSAVATDVAGNASTTSPTGHLFYADQPVADPNAQVDDLSSLHHFSDNANVSVQPLANGGFVEHWTVDSNLDGNGDTIAIQRYDANGNPDGGVVQLTGLSALLNAQGADVGSHSLTALSSGGYALAFSVDQPEYGRFVTFGTTNSGFNGTVGIVGVPQYIETQGVPSGVTFNLVGLNAAGTATASVAVTAVDGTIAITPAILAQFAHSDRLTLTASNIPSGTNFSAVVITHVDKTYDTAAALVNTSLSVNTNLPQGGVVALGSAGGRNETFQLGGNAPTPASVKMIINLPQDTSLDTTGLTNPVTTMAGALVFDLAVNANGSYSVPQSILDQLGDSDAGIALLLFGLPAGQTAFDYSVGLRVGSDIPEGVYTQTFDATGAATSDGTLRLDTSGTAVRHGSEAQVDVTARSDGSYVVRWVTDANHDGHSDSAAFQVIDANGSAQGSPVTLSGLSPLLTDNTQNVEMVDVKELAGGEHVLVWSVGLPQAALLETVTANASNPAPVLGLIGHLMEVSVTNAPTGTTFELTGVDANNAPVSVYVPVVDGKLAITPEVLANFAYGTPYNLVTHGLASGASATFVIRTEVGGHADLTTATHTVSFSNPMINGLAIMFPQGGVRGEAYHLDASVGTPTFALMILRPAFGTGGLNVTGLTGVGSGVGNGTIQPDGSIQLFMKVQANGDYVVPPELAAQLGDQMYTTTMLFGGIAAGTTVTGTVTGHDLVATTEGVFTQTFAADGTALGGASARIDDAGSHLVATDTSGANVGITPLAGGGYAVHWLVDGNRDGNTDGIAFQRYDATGAKVGDVVMLQGVIETLGAIGDHIGSYDFEALDSGGYVATYSVDLPTYQKTLTGTAVSAAHESNFGFAGVPTELRVVKADAGATFRLAGLDAQGHEVSLVVAPQADGTIPINAADLQIFANPDRISLVVGNVTNVPEISVVAAQAVHFDTSASTHTEAGLANLLTGTGITGAGSQLGYVTSLSGRIEAFHLDQVSYATSLHLFSLTITTARDPHSYDITGIAGASYGTNGAINITVSPDANNNIVVPAALLAQIGSEDASIALVGLNLTAGAAFSATVTVRDSIDNPFGVFVQTYDSHGVPLTNDLSFAGLTGADILVGLGGADTLSSGGGVDVLMGAGGNDTLQLTGPVDPGTVVNGGDGYDTLVLAPTAASLQLASGSYVPLFNAQLTSIEQIAFAPVAPTSSLKAIVANDQLSDGMTFKGDTGTDQLVVSTPDGGGTFTMHSYNLANWTGGDAVIFTAGPSGDYTLNAPVHPGFLVLAGNVGNDTLNGTDGVEILNGGLGNDTINAGGGNDTLSAGGGMDVLHGGLGNDTLIADGDIVLGSVFDGGDGSDTLRIDPASATFSPAAGGHYTALFNATLTGIETIAFNSASGGALQVIANVTQLSDGMTISGGAGADTFIIGTSQSGGSFTMPNLNFANWNPSAGDTVIFTAAGSSVDTTLTVGAHNTFVIAQGGDGNDTLSGANYMMGGAGNDTLIGNGSGRTTLIGGAGADIFVLDSPTGQALSMSDIIQDFEVGTDHMKLSGGLTFSDIHMVQGDPGTNGAQLTDALVVSNVDGSILASMTNTDAAKITAASFM